MQETVFLQPFGGVQEWLNWHAWKVCIGEILSRVRIPSPPLTILTKHIKSS